MHPNPIAVVVAVTTPLVAIGLSWRSFLWAEEGATPDGYGGVPWEATIFQAEEARQPGMRARSRMNARTCFDCGALLLAAAVPAEMLVGGAYSPTFWVWLLYGVFVASTVVRAGCGVIAVWRHRREDAFNFWFSGDMNRLYDRDKAWQLFERENPMPIW
ncbi:MAG: hypothetical protein ACP5O6_13195, partial [Candidatus Baltobacteraceae bacterium]